MRSRLLILLLSLSLSGFGQQIIFMPHTPSDGSPSSTGAEMILLFEDDYSDEKNNYTITPQGSPVFDTSPTPPEGSYSLDINGAKYLEVSSVDVGDSFTWIAEIYTGPTGSKTIVGAMDGNDGYRLSVDATNDDIYLYTGNGTDLNNASALNVGLSDYTFMQIAVTVDVTAGTAVIYLDGSDVTTDSTIRTDFETSSEPLIGARQSIGSYLYGNIDAVQLYLWELTSTQISNANTTPGQEQTQ